MNQQNQQDESVDGEEIDMVAEWGSYTTDKEKDQIEAETWNMDAIKVWPAGKAGPEVALTELAAWRAEERRMKAALELLQPDEEAEDAAET